METENMPTKASTSDHVRLSKHQRRQRERETMSSWSLHDAVVYLNTCKSKRRWDTDYVSRSAAALWVAKRLGVEREKALLTLRELGASKATRRICESQWRGLRKQEARRKEQENAKAAALAVADRISRTCGLPLDFSPTVEIQHVGAAPLLCCAIDAALDVVGNRRSVEDECQPSAKYKPSTGVRYTLELFRKSARLRLHEQPDISYRNLVQAIDHSMNLYEIYATASDLQDYPEAREGEVVFSQDDTLLEAVYYVLLGAGGFCEELLGVDGAQDWVRRRLLHEPLIRVCCAKWERELTSVVSKDTKNAAE